MNFPEKMSRPPEDSGSLDTDSFLDCLNARGELPRVNEEKLNQDEVVGVVRQLEREKIPELTELIEKLRRQLHDELGYSVNEVLPTYYQIPEDNNEAIETNKKLLEAKENLEKLKNKAQQLRHQYDIPHQVIH